MEAKEKKVKKKISPGQKPKKLKIIGSWKEAVKKSLMKKKPPEGWPE